MMNAPVEFALPDVQASAVNHGLVIEAVGIKSIQYPLQFCGRAGAAQPVVATCDLMVSLPAEQKGTHMSRFVAWLDSLPQPLDFSSLKQQFAGMLDLLEANAGEAQFSFTYFIRKSAPISGVSSLLDYHVTLHLSKAVGQPVDLRLVVKAPVTSLCPCSKQISRYGAHNQRSEITLDVLLAEKAVMDIEDLVAIAETEASCELYGLLKRPDEKYVTERAYENPKFVEDLVRDMAVRLLYDDRVLRFTVASENFESIHNHSAYARIHRDKRQ